MEIGMLNELHSFARRLTGDVDRARVVVARALTAICVTDTRGDLFMRVRDAFLDESITN